MRTQPVCRPAARRAAVLLVVILVLSMSTVVGVPLVFPPPPPAEAPRLFRDAQTQYQPAADPELLLGYFLGQLVYDVPDDASGVYSALRGHSLARSMYGANGGAAPSLPAQPTANLVPFNGTGRLHAVHDYNGRVQADHHDLINYTYFPADSFLRDPERLGWRADLSKPRGPFTGG